MNKANQSQAGQATTSKPRRSQSQKQTRAKAPAPARALPAAPSGDYLKMVEARLRAMPDWEKRLEEPPDLTLNLPGLASGNNIGRELFKGMIGDLHWHADTIRAELLPQIGSAWELVELEELLAIAADTVGDDSMDLPKDSKESVWWSIRESTSLMFRSRWTLRETMVFGAFVLHWHAAAISKLVLPKLKHTDAVQLAQSLVIAEHVVMRESTTPKAVNVGTVATPTKLQEQAWTLMARLWQEWPRDKKFCALLDSEKDDLVGQRVGLAPASEPDHKAA